MNIDDNGSGLAAWAGVIITLIVGAFTHVASVVTTRQKVERLQTDVIDVKADVKTVKDDLHGYINDVERRNEVRHAETNKLLRVLVRRAGGDNDLLDD